MRSNEAFPPAGEGPRHKARNERQITRPPPGGCVQWARFHAQNEPCRCCSTAGREDSPVLGQVHVGEHVAFGVHQLHTRQARHCKAER